MVSVEIVTREADIAEISRVLGIPAAASSHTKGDQRGFKDDVWDVTIWKCESTLEDSRPLQEHVDHLLPRILPAIIRERAKLPKDCDMYLNVGATFQTAYCSVSLSSDHLKRLSDAGIGLEVTTYPSSG